MRVPAYLGRALGLWIALLVVTGAASAAEPQFPPLSGRVVDQAGILSAATPDRLTAVLAAHEQASREQVVIVTLASLQGFPIEDFGYRLGRSWGIGEKGKNTGALLIIAPKERTVRIEVGYGLEGRLTDAICRAIIERDIVPAFRQGDFDRGVVAGTAALLGALGGASTTDAVRQPGAQAQDEGGLLSLLVLIVILLVVYHVHGRRHGYWSGTIGGGTWSVSSGSSDSSDSSGGFSGGGGSFGGGGASGRW